jgi:hypothetical protein
MVTLPHLLKMMHLFQKDEKEKKGEQEVVSIKRNILRVTSTTAAALKLCRP